MPHRGVRVRLVTPSVRRATLQDAETIAAFNIELARETEDVRLAPEVIGPGVVAVLGNEALGLYFVAEMDGRIAGQTMITREWSDWRNGMFWWIQSVFVDPAFRERGVFAALHDRVREAAREAGAIGLRLYVHDHNGRAQDVYARRGMARAGYIVLEELL